MMGATDRPSLPLDSLLVGTFPCVFLLHFRVKVSRIGVIWAGHILPTSRQCKRVPILSRSRGVYTAWNYLTSHFTRHVCPMLGASYIRDGVCAQN